MKQGYTLLHNKHRAILGLSNHCQIRNDDKQFGTDDISVNSWALIHDFPIQNVIKLQAAIFFLNEPIFTAIDQRKLQCQKFTGAPDLLAAHQKLLTNFKSTYNSI